MAPKVQKGRPAYRPPRIRVPNKERALFTIEGSQKFIGVIQRLSLTGGSAVLSKGPIPHGTFADMALMTVFGKVAAEIEFLHTGADGVAMAQAFRFIDMSAVSRKRFDAAIKQMQGAGFSDDRKGDAGAASAGESLTKLWDNICRLSGIVASSRSTETRTDKPR